MAKITPDIEFTGVETLKTIFRKFAVGSEAQQRLLYQGLQSVGRVAEGGTDNPGLAEMTDLSMAAIIELLQSPDLTDRILAVEFPFRFMKKPERQDRQRQG